jgi:hypothetical protein
MFPASDTPRPSSLRRALTTFVELVTLAPGAGEEPEICPDPYHHPHRRSAALNLPARRPGRVAAQPQICRTVAPAARQPPRRGQGVGGGHAGS